MKNLNNKKNSKNLKLERKKKIPCQKNAIILVLSIEKITLLAELSGSPHFKMSLER